MDFSIRKLKTSDYNDVLKGWWKDWGWQAPAQDFLPENGEGIEYNTKTTRLDLDNPSSTHQKFIFFFYISVLGFIAYQLHQIFYFDEYPNYEANEEDESYY